VFPRVEELALADPRFADTFCWCWRFGQSDQPANAARFESLKARLLARGAAYPAIAADRPGRAGAPSSR